MQKKLIARTAKLSSETKKNRKAKGIAVSYEHIPKNLDERNHGSIYAVINVNASVDRAEEITELIIDSFHGEYYSDLSKSPVESFESALSRVNEELAEATQQGNTEWLNNLNAVLMVLKDTTIHLTQAGKADAYLYRNEKSTLISDGLAGDTVNPLRTFITVASGELQEGDKLALATHDIFFYISKEELRKFVIEFHPSITIEHVANLLEGISHDVKPNAVLVLEMITPEAASEEIVSSPSDVWIAPPTKPMQDAIEAATPFLKKTTKISKKYFSTIGAFFADGFYPKIKNKAKDLYEKTEKKVQEYREDKALKEIEGEKILHETDESISDKDFYDEYGESFDKKESKLKPQAEDFDKPSISKKSNDLYIKEESINRPKWLPLERISFSRTKTPKMKIKGSPNKTRTAILAFVFVLLIGGGIGIFLLSKSNTEKKNRDTAQASLNEINSKFDEGKNLIATGKNSEAITTFTQIKDSAEKLKDNKYVGNDAIAIIASIENALDQAGKVTRINTYVFADIENIVGKNTFGPYLLGDYLYLISSENGKIASINITNSETTTVLETPSIEGRIVSANAVVARNTIVVFTDTPAIYEFDTSDNTFSKQAVAGEIEKPNSVSSFSSNIYSLDTANGEIYKRLRTSAGYAKRTEYITDGTNIANAVSMAIDSSVFVLNNDGTITQFLSGEKQAFSVTGLPSTISGVNYLYTDEETDFIFFADTAKGRVIQINKSGEFISQYASNNFTTINGIIVNGTDKIIYVASEGKIYKINY